MKIENKHIEIYDAISFDSLYLKKYNESNTVDLEKKSYNIKLLVNELKENYTLNELAHIAVYLKSEIKDYVNYDGDVVYYSEIDNLNRECDVNFESNEDVDENDIEYLYVSTNLKTIIKYGYENYLKYFSEKTKFHNEIKTINYDCSLKTLYNLLKNEYVRKLFNITIDEDCYRNKRSDGTYELTYINDFNSDVLNNDSINTILRYSEISYNKILKELNDIEYAKNILSFYMLLKTNIKLTSFSDDFKYISDYLNETNR